MTNLNIKRGNSAKDRAFLSIKEYCLGVNLVTYCAYATISKRTQTIKLFVSILSQNIKTIMPSAYLASLHEIPKQLIRS